MIIYNNSKGYEPKKCEKIIFKAKIKLFEIMQLIQNSNIISFLIFKGLLVLETLQLTFFVINPKYTFLWDSPILNLIQTLLEYTQINTMLDQQSTVLFMTLLYTSLGLVIFTTGSFFYLMSQPFKSTVLLQILSVYCMFLVTVLSMPLFNAFFSAIICNSEENFVHTLECGSGIAIIHMISGIIGLIFLIPQIFICNQLYIDLNPFSSFPNAALPSNIPWIKCFLKFILPLYSLMNRNMENGKVINLGLMLIFSLIVILRIRIPAFYRKDILNTAVLCEGMLMWVTICTCIQGYVEKTGEETDIMSVIYFLIGIPLFNFAMVSALLSQRENNVLETDPNTFYKPDQIRVYVNIFIKKIEEQITDKGARMKVMGILKIHQNKCNNFDCPCSNMSPKQIRKDGILENRRQWYIILKFIIYEFLEKNPKCCDLLLLSSFIHFERLNLKYKSLTELMKLEELNPDFQISFCMYYQKHVLEYDIQLVDGRNSVTEGNVDVNSIVLFQNQFVIFKDAVENSNEQHCEFWIELQEPKIDIQKLNSLGEKIQGSILISTNQYKSLLKLNNNNLMSMEIYANYMRQVVNNEDQAEILLDKLKYLQKTQISIKQSNKNSQSQNQQSGSKSKQKNSDSDNNNTCVVTLSTNLRQFGIIKNSNYDLMRMFGYKRQEVVENNINMLMPKCYANIHDNILQNFIENSDTITLQRQRIVLAQNKDGFCVPCDLIVKVLPNLDEGMQLVGFLNELQSYYCPPYTNKNYQDRYTQHYIVYNKQNLNISSCTQSCYKCFGIPTGLINSNSSAANNFTLDLICPEIEDPFIQQELKENGTVEVDFDTTIIGLQFLLSSESNKQDKLFQKKDEEDGELDINLNKSQLNNNNKQDQNVSQLDKSDINLNPQIDNIQQQKQQQVKQLIGGATQQQNSDPQDFLYNSQEELDYNINQAYDDYMAIQYKSTRIKIYLESDTKGYVVIRFEDLNEPERMDPEDEDNYDQNDILQKSYQQNINQNNIIQDDDCVEDMDQNNQLLKSEKQKQISQREIEEQHHQTSSGGKSKSKSKSKGKSTKLFSEGSSLNQKSIEQRYIKDLQLTFSDKTQSVTVMFLQRTTILLYLLFLSILTYQFIQKLSLRNNLTNSIQAIYIANNRHTVMPDSNFFSRQIYLDSNDYYLYESESLKQEHKDQISTQLKAKVKELHEIQFDVLDQIEIIKEFYDKPIKMSSFNLKFQMPNGNIFEDSYSVTDGMLLMVAAVSSIAETSLDSLKQEQLQQTYNTDQRYFYYITQNGMLDLRYGSELFSVELQNIYTEYVNSFQGPNLLVLIINLIISITFGIVLVPMIFRVQNQNNEILSIFALLPIQEIQNFVAQCQSFKQSYLIERTIDQILQNKEEDRVKKLEEQQKQEDKINKSLQNMAILENHNNQKNNINNNNSTTQDISTNASPDLKAITDGPLLTKMQDQIQENNLNLNQNNQKPISIEQQQQINSRMQQIQEELDKEDEEDDIVRSEKIINSNKDEKKNIVIKFSILTILFLVYFISDNILETVFLEDVILCIKHTQMMAARPSHIKYTILFALEEIVQGEQQWYDGNEMLQLYQKKIYDNELGVEESYQESFPGNFDEYKEQFDQYNYSSMCENSMWTELEQESEALLGSGKGYKYKEKCNTLQGGVLEKGLAQSIKTIYENIRTFITEWRESIKSGITLEKQQQYLNSQTFQELIQLQDFLLPILYFLLDNFRDMYQNYISYSILVQQITFGTVTTVITTLFIFIWIPFIIKLSKVTQRIKGMLNMFPVSLILKNKHLKNAFKQDGILKYFK